MKFEAIWGLHETCLKNIAASVDVGQWQSEEGNHTWCNSSTLEAEAEELLSLSKPGLQNF